MSASRTREILEGWRPITRAAALPNEPPRPRRANSFGIAAMGFVAILVVALALRSQATATSGNTSSSSPSGSTAIAAQTAAPASPSPTGLTSTSSNPPLPAVGGTCSAGQFVLGTATSGPAFGTIGTTVMYLTQPLRNLGASCLLELPKVIGAVSATGQFVAVHVAETGTPSFEVGARQSLSLVLSARWASGGTLANGTSPCHDPVGDVIRVVIPLASGTIQLDLNPTWHEVCPGPASVSLALTN